MSTVTPSPTTPLPYRPLIICGPSGVGKGTLLTRLFNDYPSIFGKKISHTTRAPRAGEVDGVAYYFISKPQFEADIAKGLFIEHALVHTNYYGTSIQSVRHIAQSGRIPVLEVDVQGAEALLKSDLDPFYFFILPPSFDALRERLQGRGSESEDTLKTRLATAQNELEFAERRRDIFHVQLVNDDLDKAYERMKEEIRKCYPDVKL